MSTSVSSAAEMVQWGTAKTACPGNAVCGDAHFVCGSPSGLLFAVIDGLGHGEGAAAAAAIALNVLGTHTAEPVAPLLKKCHEALKPTRGAAITLALFDAITFSLTWVGVGNVEALILRRFGNTARVHQCAMLFPGVVGHQLPSLRASVTQLEPQDLLVFFTDGISREFLSVPITGPSPQGMAAGICNRYSKGTDDALVLVARFTKTQPH